MFTNEDGKIKESILVKTTASQMLNEYFPLTDTKLFLGGTNVIMRSSNASKIAFSPPSSSLNHLITKNIMSFIKITNNFI